MSLARFLRTIRHIPPQQLMSFALRRAMPWPPLGSRRPAAAPPFPGVRWKPKGAFLPSASKAHRSPADIDQGTFTFLGEPRQLGWPPDWQALGATKLWQYHLHYLDILWTLPYEDARDLTRSWVDAQGNDETSVAMEPYPLSLRVVNLCGVFFGGHAAATLADAPFLALLWGSVHAQVQRLTQNLETHLRANHLAENAFALAVAGACFQGSGAGRWRALGRRLLRSELSEQILADGGHFERSPMYQVRLTWALAFLINTGDEEIGALARPALERSLAALRSMCHPDEGIALLNDSGQGVQNEPAEVLDYGDSVLESSTGSSSWGAFSLPNVGYFGSREPNGDYVIADAGTIGPDYQPGHGHADLFSFELSLSARRIVVDSGNYDYEDSPTRAYCRSTRAHSTVDVNGEDQCEMWGVFRVGRRAKPRDVCFQGSETGFSLSAWHDGYAHLSGSPRHRREITWHARRRLLLVSDAIDSTRPVIARSRVHFHPTCKLVDRGESFARLTCGDQPVWVHFPEASRVKVEKSWYCPSFGSIETRACLTLELAGENVKSLYAISAERPGSITLDPQIGARVDGQLLAGAIAASRRAS
jgi:uncharacterized heparinase superfamily protein